MFNGFSAIEQLIKMASVHMPKFRQMVDDAETEYFALRNAAQQSVQRTADTRCDFCAGTHGWHEEDCPVTDPANR